MLHHGMRVQRERERQRERESERKHDDVLRSSHQRSNFWAGDDGNGRWKSGMVTLLAEIMDKSPDEKMIRWKGLGARDMMHSSLKDADVAQRFHSVHPFISIVSCCCVSSLLSRSRPSISHCCLSCPMFVVWVSVQGGLALTYEGTFTALSFFPAGDVVDGACTSPPAAAVAALSGCTLLPMCSCSITWFHKQSTRGLVRIRFLRCPPEWLLLLIFTYNLNGADLMYDSSVSRALFRPLSHSPS